MSAAADAVMTTPIDAAVLGQWLQKVGVKIAPGKLEEACRADQSEETAQIKPADRLTNILAQVQQKKLQVAQLSWNRLDRRHLPVLVWYDHAWRIAEHVDHSEEEDTVRLTGPTTSQTVVPAALLTSNPVLWVRLPPDEQRIGELLQTDASRMLIKEVFQKKRWLIEVIVATVVVNLLAVFTSLFSMQVYDRVVPTFAYSTLMALVTGMVIVLVLDWSLKFIRARILDTMAKQVDLQVSQRLFEHLLRLRLDTRPRSLGSLAAQMNGLETVRNFFSSTIVFGLTDMPFALMFIAIIATLGGLISLVYILLLLVAVTLGWLAQRWLRDLARLEIQRNFERHGLLVDTIQGAETIQATGGGWLFADLWAKIAATMATYSLKSKLIASTTTTTTSSLGTIAYIAALVVGVMQIEAGNLTTGGLIACTILGGKVIGPVAQSVGLLVQWQHVRESLAMVNRLLEMETDRRSDQVLLVPENLPDTLDLDGVRFSYPNSPMVRLQTGSLSFKAGDRVVILGPNGCGKSTLLKVAAGLYKPAEGQARIGGADLWELDPQVVNERIGYLPQDVHLFKGTLKSNLALAGGVSDTALLEVAKLLGIDALAADNPRSMEMEISEGGQGLSGGQRQLVGLARVFLVRPRLWLLDEPSASLDMESENRMFEALRTQIRPTDIVLIATHRPRLISLATRVLVMQRGQITADGKPEEVLQRMQRRVRKEEDGR
jgi:ATP-binding cassette subfamily C protein LapB